MLPAKSESIKVCFLHYHSPVNGYKESCWTCYQETTFNPRGYMAAGRLVELYYFSPRNGPCLMDRLGRNVYACEAVKSSIE